MEGSADLERETEDLRVVVVPEINAGTASLAYAVINPAIGLGTFLAQYFLRKPLMAASTREFRVTGPWDDPKVERVERSALGDAATADSTPPTEPAPAGAALPRRRGADEDRRRADGLDAERRAQPRDRAPPRRAGRRATAPTLVVLPEYFCFMGQAAIATSWRSPRRPATGRSSACSPRARASTGVWLVGGTLPLAAADARRARGRRRGDRAMNANLVFSPRGELAARYDKIHLFATTTAASATTRRARCRPAARRSPSMPAGCASA